jgi:hypothetical protein
LLVNQQVQELVVLEEERSQQVLPAPSFCGFQKDRRRVWRPLGLGRAAIMQGTAGT